MCCRPGCVVCKVSGGCTVELESTVRNQRIKSPVLRPLKLMSVVTLVAYFNLNPLKTSGNCWLIDCDGLRLTSQNRCHHWPVVHPPGECEWRAVVAMMPAGDNSWLVYQSSLAVLPAETSRASRRNGRRNENFAYSVSSIHQQIFYVP
jgi:hypothetical protein